MREVQKGDAGLVVSNTQKRLDMIIDYREFIGVKSFTSWWILPFLNPKFQTIKTQLDPINSDGNDQEQQAHFLRASPPPPKPKKEIFTQKTCPCGAMFYSRLPLFDTSVLKKTRVQRGIT